MQDAVIAVSPATDSNVFSADYDYGDAAAIGIRGKTVQSGTYSIAVSTDGTNFSTLQIGATPADIAVPASGKALVYGQELVSWPYFKIVIAPTNAGSSVFEMTKHFTVGAGLGGS
jgi:hypothetical protein